MVIKLEKGEAWQARAAKIQIIYRRWLGGHYIALRGVTFMEDICGLGVIWREIETRREEIRRPKRYGDWTKK